MRLDQDSVRSLHLAAMDLAHPPTHQATKDDVLATIQRMGTLQIDSINVVARSPYLVLRSRLGDFDPAWLDELLREKRIFEYWSHEACFLPIEDFPIYRRFILDGLKRVRRSSEWLASHELEVGDVLTRIRDRGAVRSVDFTRTDGKGGGWWDWKPEKQALDHLHTTGELMIAERRNFQRVYDLRERILPAWRDQDAPSLDSALSTLALTAVRALGIAKPSWVPDYFRTPKPGSAARLERLADEGLLVRARVDGWQEPGYVHPECEDTARRAAAGDIRPSLTTLLSPFDPLVWDRARVLDVFGFEYRIECYTPAPKRRYGYFSLPILHRGRLVGRLDAKAHRQDGIFEVRTLHIEPNVATTKQLVRDLRRTLSEWARWHKTPTVAVTWSDPPHLASLLSPGA